MGASWLEPGTEIGGRFVLVERLGAGGFGEVWRAGDARGGAEVAIKVLRPELLSDTDVRDRFAREAKILEQLEHPNIARAIAWRIEDQVAYLALELVEGVDLAAVEVAWARSGTPPPVADVLHLFGQICAAVDHAHRRGITHRDLKPRNVMVLPRRGQAQVKVLDFGIAKILTGDAANATTVGRALGTPFYMAPEQARGLPADPRIDVFALGTMLFEMLTLHLAWARRPDDTPLSLADLELLRHDVNHPIAVFGRLGRGPRPVPSVARPELGRVFDAVVSRALAIDPDTRPSTAAELASEVEKATAGVVVKAAPPRVTPVEWGAQMATDTLVTPRALTEMKERAHVAAPATREAKPGSATPMALVALGLILGGGAAWLVLPSVQRIGAEAPPAEVVAPPRVETAPGVETARPVETAPGVEPVTARPLVTPEPATRALQATPALEASPTAPAPPQPSDTVARPAPKPTRPAPPRPTTRTPIEATTPTADPLASREAVRAESSRLLKTAMDLRRRTTPGSATATDLDDLILQLTLAATSDPEETRLRLPALERRLRALAP